MSSQFKSALVLLSGGQDSTVCLAWALTTYSHVETIGFAYGQRHAIELQARSTILNSLPQLHPEWRPRLGPDHLLSLNELGQISRTSLTRDTEIAINQNGLPTTFVPGRNLLFFVYAAAVAYRRGISTLVGGMCETDFSGYPDCRNETLRSLAQSISLGMDAPMEITTPLMWIDKAETWAMAHRLGGAPLVELITEDTHTCYRGDRTRRHPWGYGCATCPACTLRKTGWERWQTLKSKQPT